MGTGSSEFSSTRFIGQNTEMLFTPEKVSGFLHFLGDLKLSRELVGKVLRSPYPHAAVAKVDIDTAKRLPGVKAIITRENVLEKKYGAFVADETVLAYKKVRYVGEEVAAVAAETEEIALEAIQKIKVTYEPLKAVFDPFLALKGDSPLIHEDRPGNIAAEIKIDRGNVESAWKECAVIVQDTFQTAVQHHTYLEPFGCIASLEDDGRIVLYAPVQDPFPTRAKVANALGLTESSIRVIQTPVGGSFGGKANHIKLLYLCTRLALEAKRPVKMVHTYEEEFLAGRPRSAWTIRMKLGARKDGVLLAKETDIVGNNGAYTTYSIAPLQIASIRNDSIYRIKNIKTRSKLVYTNTVPAGAMRGIGNTQSTFGLESLVDEIARALSMDPVDLRLKNAHSPGEVSVHGWKIESCGLPDCLKRIKAVRSECFKPPSEEGSKGTKKTGYGIAASIHVSSNRGIRASDASTVMIRINEDGKIHVYTSEVDMGQGLPTVLTMIVAEELGVNLDDIFVSPRVDTDLSPFGWGTGASRCTLLVGNAARSAAQKARESILREASEILDSDVEPLCVSGGIISIVKEPQRSCTFAEVARRAAYKRGGSSIITLSTYDAPTTSPDSRWYGNPHPGLSYSAQLAEVEVDTETGQIDIKRIFSVHDVGRGINPMACRGQIEGAILQGIGFARFEDLRIDQRTGIPLNKNFADYRIPSSLDIPKIESFLVESHHPSGPYGAKGIGQDGIVPILASIANAIYDATGIRIRKVPVTQEELWARLHGYAQNTSESFRP